MPITQMSINEAEIDFDAKMYDIIPDDLTAEYKDEIKKINPEYDPIKIIAEFNEKNPNVHIKIKFKSDPLPPGLSQYLNSLEKLENSVDK